MTLFASALSARAALLLLRGRERRYALKLARAGVLQRPEEYFGTLLVWSLLAGAVALVGLVATMGQPASATGVALLAGAPAAIGAATYAFGGAFLPAAAALRARRIDAQLPHALTYVATMSGAGFPPQRIFAQLAAQPVYGDVAREAALISRDIDTLGSDFVSALARASERTPSRRFQDFLQGAVTTLTAGGKLQDYFLAKSEQFQEDNEREQEKYLESLALFAESYITLVVAGPLFLIILLSVMLMFGSGSSSSLEGGYMLVLVIVPLAQAGFAVSIQAASPEA